MDDTTPDHPGVIAFPPFIYGIPWAVGLVLHLVFPVHVLPSFVARALGAALTLCAVILAVVGRRAMARAGTDPNPTKPTTALVVAGPFRFTRNPLYVSLTGLYVGLSLLVNTLWPLVLLPGVLFVMQRGVIDREERYLERKFGDDYRRYKAQVRRWI